MFSLYQMIVYLWPISDGYFIIKLSNISFKFNYTIKIVSIMHHLSIFVFDKDRCSSLSNYFDSFPSWYWTRPSAHFWHWKLCTIHSSRYSFVNISLRFHILCFIKVSVWYLFNLWFWSYKINFIHCSISINFLLFYKFHA